MELIEPIVEKSDAELTIKRSKVKRVVLVNFVLDESGSMGVCKPVIISGFNEYLLGLRAQGEQGFDVRVTLTQFDSERGARVIYRALPVAQVPDLTEETYQPKGGTPLYDAIAASLRATAQDEAPLVPGNYSGLCIILTDGEENMSRQETKTSVAKLIAEKEQSKVWTFAYIGSNQEAWIEGGKIGVTAGSTLTYAATGQGYQDMYKSLSRSSVAYFAAGATQTANFFAGGGGSGDKIIIGGGGSANGSTGGGQGGNSSSWTKEKN